MHRKPDGVESPCRHRIDIDLPDIIRQPLIIKDSGLLRTDQFGYLFADAILRPDLAKLQHIAFLQHPSAKPDATQNNFIAFFIDDKPALGLQKSLTETILAETEKQQTNK